MGPETWTTFDAKPVEAGYLRLETSTRVLDYERHLQLTDVDGEVQIFIGSKNPGADYWIAGHGFGLTPDQADEFADRLRALASTVRDRAIAPPPADPGAG